jgi:hypothetical protein
MCSVKVQDTTSGIFEYKFGPRQGDELTTKLFNIALEGVFRRAKLELNGTIFTKAIQLLGFVDDADIGVETSGLLPTLTLKWKEKRTKSGFE